MRSTYGASAGSRRGSTAHTTASAAISPISVVDRRDPALADDQVADRVAGEHGDPAGRQPLLEGRRDPGHPAGDRPGAEALLEVGGEPHPRRHVARVVAAGDERVRGDHRQPVVAEAAAQPLVHALPAVEVRRDLAGQVVGSPGHLEVVPPQHVPDLGVLVDVAGSSCRRGRVRARRTPPSARRVSRRAAGRRCRRRTGARGSPPAAPAPRPPSPAAGRTCGTGRGPPPAAGWRAGRRPRRTRPARRCSARRRAWSDRSSRVTSWPSLASLAALAMPPNPPPTTTTRMAGTLVSSQAGVGALRSPRPFQRRQPRRISRATK